MKYKTTAPCRIDLAGGTLDINPVYLFLDHPCTVNLGISIGVEITVEEIPGDTSLAILEDFDFQFQLPVKGHPPLPQGGELVAVILRHFHARGLGAVKVTTRSFSPKGAGLAASSTLCVALTATLARMIDLKLEVNPFVQLCLDLEATILKTPAGYQDFYPAYKGGFQEIKFFPGEIVHRTLAANLEELNRRITLVYTGKPHHSGLNNYQVFQAVMNGDAGVISCLSKIGRIAGAMGQAVEKGDLDEISTLLDQEWQQRKHLSPVVSTPVIDALVDTASSIGGAGKVCGSGGGGCVILCHDGEKSSLQKLEAKARELDVEILPWKPSPSGCVIETV